MAELALDKKISVLRLLDQKFIVSKMLDKNFLS